MADVTFDGNKDLLVYLGQFGNQGVALLNVCLISPGDTIFNLMRIAPMQKINFREYLAVATALVIIVAFFHQWVLTF